MLSKKKLFTLLGFLISLLFVGIFVFSILAQRALEDFISREIIAYGFSVIFIFSAILDLIPQYIAPHFIILNASFLGISSNFLIFLVIAGSTAGAFFGFILGRNYGFSLSEELFGEKNLNKTKNLLNKYGKWFVALAALSPLPYIPIIFGSLGMSRKNFILYGMIPRIISFFLFVILFT